MGRRGRWPAPARPLPQTPPAGRLDRGSRTTAAPSPATHPPAGCPGRPGVAAREQSDGGRRAQHPAAAGDAGCERRCSGRNERGPACVGRRRPVATAVGERRAGAGAARRGGAGPGGGAVGGRRALALPVRLHFLRRGWPAKVARHPTPKAVRVPPGRRGSRCRLRCQGPPVPSSSDALTAHSHPGCPRRLCHIPGGRQDPHTKSFIQY